ncbi:hypothetical protein [Rubripirellula reticaptiva]|uniref:Uncharacterized protein n=1 Tax=Rubripirellula reticaptiva TaxID=2528013 RepID=A0A5C6F8S6_9BACT|nr:hypothetical protein [Rubripirellula reticaptiva]TWU57312.1 hypothetical protein Poly59_02190 [Rubripirellula reticaptiva]
MSDSQPDLLTDAPSDPAAKEVTEPSVISSGTGADDADDRTPAANEAPSISKSQRVRDYIAANPKARNKDIVTALGSFGIKVGDVASVKSKLRQHGDKPALKRRGRPKGPKKSESKVASDPKPAKSTAKPARPAMVSSTDATVGIDVLEQCVEFIRKAGGIDHAQNALDLIRRIRSL